MDETKGISEATDQAEVASHAIGDTTSALGSRRDEVNSGSPLHKARDGDYPWLGARQYRRRSTNETIMAAPESPDDNDASTNEDRFARQDFQKYSHLSSALAIIAIVIAIAAVFIFLAIRR